VKIHVRSGKLTLLFYDDFDSSPLPRLRERIKINMREQKIDFFQYSKGTESQLTVSSARAKQALACDPRTIKPSHHRGEGYLGGLR
jgi:hypothetical protein